MKISSVLYWGIYNGNIDQNHSYHKKCIRQLIGAYLLFIPVVHQNRMSKPLHIQDFLKTLQEGCQANVREILTDLPTGHLEKSQNRDQVDQHSLNDCDQDDEAAAHIMGRDGEVSDSNLKTLAHPNLPMEVLKTSLSSDQLDLHIGTDHGDFDEADVEAALILGISNEIRSAQQKQ